MKLTKETIKSKYYQSQVGKTIRIRLSEINVLEETDKIFIKHQETKDSIKASMKEIGFDKSCPIKCFIFDGKLYVYEGHTRLQCASEIGLDYVWIYIDGKMTKEEAINKTISEQLSRRNCDDADLVHCFIQLKAQGLSVSSISEHLMKSKRQLYKVQEILIKADDSDITDLKNAKIGINELYVKIKEAEKLQDSENQESLQQKSDETDNSIEIDENDVIQNVDNIEQENLQKRHRDLDARENELKKREVEINQQPTNQEVFLIGLKLGVIEMLKGNNPISIINDPKLLSVSDFSSLISAEDLAFLGSKLEVVNG